MNISEALSKLSNLPGGPFGVDGQLGVSIKFSGPGNLTAFTSALADDPLLGGTHLNGTPLLGHGGAHLQTLEKLPDALEPGLAASDTHTVTTFMPLQAPDVLRLLAKYGFVIDDVYASVMPPIRFKLLLMGRPGSGKSPVVAEMQRLYRSKMAERAGAALPDVEDPSKS